MTNEALKARLRYTVEHGLIAAAKTDMAASYAESLEAIERLEAENARLREAAPRAQAPLFAELIEAKWGKP